MEELMKEALRFVLVTEQRTERLLGDAAAGLTEGYGKAVLERVAAEQRRGVEEVLRRYPVAFPGGDQETSHQLARPAVSVASVPERRLLETLQRALHDQHRNLVQYRAILDAFREPVICDIFSMASGLSQRLLERVTEEFTKAKLKRQRPVPNKRAKRTHIRTGFLSAPPPNRHSQLFISLLDCGRPPLQGREF